MLVYLYFCTIIRSKTILDQIQLWIRPIKTQHDCITFSCSIKKQTSGSLIIKVSYIMYNKWCKENKIVHVESANLVDNLAQKFIKAFLTGKKNKQSCFGTLKATSLLTSTSLTVITPIIKCEIKLLIHSQTLGDGLVTLSHVLLGVYLSMLGWSMSVKEASVRNTQLHKHWKELKDNLCYHCRDWNVLRQIWQFHDY